MHHPMLLYRYLASVASKCHMVTTTFGRWLSHKHMTEITHHILITRWSSLIWLPSSLGIIEHISQILIHADFQMNRMSQSLTTIPSFWVSMTQLISDSLWITLVDYWSSWILMYIRTFVSTSLSRLGLLINIRPWIPILELALLSQHYLFSLRSKILASESAIQSVCDSDSFALRLSVQPLMYLG